MIQGSHTENFEICNWAKRRIMWSKYDHVNNIHEVRFGDPTYTPGNTIWHLNTMIKMFTLT